MKNVFLSIGVAHINTVKYGTSGALTLIITTTCEVCRINPLYVYQNVCILHEPLQFLTWFYLLGEYCVTVLLSLSNVQFQQFICNMDFTWYLCVPNVVFLNAHVECKGCYTDLSFIPCQ